MHIYRVILVDGKSIPIDSECVENVPEEGRVKFFKQNKLVASFNTDKIVGWIEDKYELP